MADYDFQSVLVWDVNPGGTVRTLRNGTVTVKNAATDATLFTVESDNNGLATFTTTDVATVYLVSPNGLTSEHITSATAIEAAAAAGVNNDVGTAALVNDTGSATRGALNSTFAPVSVVDDVSTNTADIATKAAQTDLSNVVGVVASGATAALVRKLRAGTDGANVLLQGDSTGNEATEWWQQALTALAARFPAYRVTARLWNDATQAYDAASTVQAGAGVARSFYATQSNGGFISTPDSAQVSVTGDIDIRIKAACDDWTPATAFELCSKSDAAPQAGWFLRLNTAGTLTLFWSADGTVVLSATSTVAVPFADGAAGWVRVTLDVDNGAGGRTVTFYTSTDGTTWTALGTAVTAAGTTSIFDNTARLQAIGRVNAHLTAPAAVAVYRFQVYSGIAGTLVADLDVTNMVNTGTPLVGPTGSTWTAGSFAAGTAGVLRGTPTLALFNASTPGKAISYSNDATRFGKQTAVGSLDLAFISYSHNEGFVTAYRAPYKQLADALIAKFPDVGIVASTQNPQLSPMTADQIAAHASRNATIRALAASQGYALVDAYDAFVRANPAALINTDGIHPNQAGSDLWAAQAEALFNGF